MHDFVTVSSPNPDPNPSQSVPSGNVHIDWFLNGDCSGNPAATSGSLGPLDANGHFDATGFAFTVSSAGQRSFKAHYEGNNEYAPSDGACEPLQVVDARITIAPDKTNEVGTSHTFTVTVQQDDGLTAAQGGDGVTGFGPASALVTTSIANSNGATAQLTGGTCGNTSGTIGSGSTDANGQCTATISSPTAGLTVANATATLSVAGVSLTRDTDPATGITAGPGGSGPATKQWVDARISIAPDKTNEVGQPHTFTATVQQDDGLTAASGRRRCDRLRACLGRAGDDLPDGVERRCAESGGPVQRDDGRGGSLLGDVQLELGGPGRRECDHDLLDHRSVQQRDGHA